MIGKKTEGGANRATLVAARKLLAIWRPSTDCQRKFLVLRKRTSYLREARKRRLFSRSRWSGDRPRLGYFKSKAMSPEMAAIKNSAPTKRDGRADRTAVDG
jgi:hypothetical protein